MTVRVLRLRIKDRHAKWLSERAREVNTVCNYCNELSRKVWERERRFLSGFDFWPFLKGVTKEGIDLPVQTVQEVAEQYSVKRRAAKKTRLAWRKSGGARRSLGWLPFKVRTIRYAHGQVCYAGQWLSLWDSYGLGQYELRAGSISEDVRGRWYLNVTVNEPDFVGPLPMPSQAECVGIDLGLKELAALSSGQTVPVQRFYRDLEPALATAQRAGKKARATAIHAKIANRRRDHLQKFSTTLVRQHRGIFVGNINAQAFAKTRLAKSVLDAGWSTLRTMLQHHGTRAKGMRATNRAWRCLGLPAGLSDRVEGRRGPGTACWAKAQTANRHNASTAPRVRVLRVFIKNNSCSAILETPKPVQSQVKPWGSRRGALAASKRARW